MIQSIGVLTSGGDSPGMNAAIRAVVRRALDFGIKVYGIYGGYEGLVEGKDQIRLLNWNDVGGIIQRGGTFLGTARSESFRKSEGRRRAVRNLLEYNIQALVVIGGDGSLMGAHILSTEWPEHVREILRTGKESSADDPDIPPLQVVGLPGSIDNDLSGTDMSLGADTALNHIVKAIDNLSSTAASHHRTFIVETMGRHCGYLALAATLAGGASWVLVPEEELDMRWHHKMVETIEKARATGLPHQMVVVAEGARHPDGLILGCNDVKKILNDRLGIDVRVTVLGHVQRGGAPSAFDRILATRLGVAAVDILLREPDVIHRHMLGLVTNQVVATPLLEVVEKSQEIAREIEQGNYQRALDLRGESFKNTLSLVKTLTRITPAAKPEEDGIVVILTGGGDAPGMNAAVSVAARCLMNRGVPVYGSQDGFLGLINGNLIELDWHDLVQWINRPGSDIGTARFELEAEQIKDLAATVRKRNVKGIIAVGGWGTYLDVAKVADLRREFDSLNIPIILLPASIDNNLPCSEYSVGADTALNNILDATDKIRHTAGATRRAFIVEVMGKQCGFLAWMSALASGAEKAYIPETGITLAELNADVEDLKKSFECGKRMVIFVRNEESSLHYTTDFIRNLLEEESKGEFEVRTAVLGHVQRGGYPTAFDRIIASRMGAAAAFALFEAMKSGDAGISVLGLQGRGVAAVPLSEALRKMDVAHGRPRQQWFMHLMDIAVSLARRGPKCGL